MQLQGDKNMNTRIIVDSTTELMPEYRDRVKVIPLIVRFGEEEYIDGVTIDHKTFYEKLIESDVLPATSQANPDTFMRAFDEIKAAGESAVVITLSSKLSGTYQSAIIAAEDYDNIYVVDSGTVTIGASILTELALKYLDEGMDARTVAEKLEEDKKKIHIVALVDTLEYLKKGGRISKTVAFAGTLLNIKPVMHVDDDGHLIKVGTVRGRKQSLNILADKLLETAEDPAHGTIFISHGDCEEDAKYLADTIKSKGGNDVQVITNVGTVIGAHSGPGTMALFFVASQR
jgi:DegV family protein with EDD domain